MMFVNSDSSLQFEVTFRGKEEFGVDYEEIHGKAYIMANSDKDIVLDISCFKIEEVAQEPDLLVELYVDGILRNVVKPRTGRGLAENQLAEAMIDRGLVLTDDGVPILKRFHFVDLDVNDAVLSSRLVKEAGTIEVRIVQAGLSFNEADDIAFELPGVCNDFGAVSLLCGELNNTVGVRFDDGYKSVHDTKEIRLPDSIKLMVLRQNQMLGETLAIFSFSYATDDILHHLGVIPPTHRLFDIEMASERQEVRTRLDAKMSKALIQKAVLCSDYSLCGDEEDTEWPAITPALPDLSLAVSCLTIHERKPKGSLALTKSARRPSRQLCSPARSSWGIHSTPAKKKSAANEMLTPPVTPGVERMVVYDMTQLDEDVMEIWYDA